MNDSTASLVVQPLLSWQPTWLDIFLPPVLIGTSLLLHTLYNSPLPTSTSTSSHLYRAKTSHARLLPASARHIFAYPVVTFGVDLGRLEAGELDLPGRLFGWEPRKWAITAFWREGYGEPGGKERIRAKVLRQLRKRGVDVDKDADSVYMVSMPDYLGKESINPLTTHFCFAKPDAEGRRELRVVVLEVHNTFGERHIYVLRVGVDEDEHIALGSVPAFLPPPFPALISSCSRYEHQWTFPRAFHVSPFNSRVGFYKVSTSSPFSTSPTHPTLAIKIIFLTPSREKKLYADLAGPGEPLSTPVLLRALAKWPFGLLLTSPRILWQAGVLSFRKGLPVWIRPEPFAGKREDGGLNPVQEGGKEGAVGWQEEGEMEKWARERVRRFLAKRVREDDWRDGRRVRVVLRSADEEVEDMEFVSHGGEEMKEGEEQVLLVTYSTPVFFTDLVASPSVSLALAVGSHTEHRWSTTNDDLFLRLFSTSSSPSILVQAAQSIRRATMSWGLSFSPLPPPRSPLPPHPLDDGTVGMVTSLASHYFWTRLGYGVLAASGAKVVVGTETWGDWARWNEQRIQDEAQ